MELILGVIGRDEVNEERLGVGEFLLGEERREEMEK